MSLRVCLCVCWLDKVFSVEGVSGLTLMLRNGILPSCSRKAHRPDGHENRHPPARHLRSVQGQPENQLDCLKPKFDFMIFMVRRAPMTRDPQFGQLVLRLYLT